VRDDEAEEFFAAFYDHLTAGETAAAAFSAAQRERIEAGAPAEGWAGFVLSGNGGWRLPGAPGEEPPALGLASKSAEGLARLTLAVVAALSVLGVLGLAARYLTRRFGRALSTRSRSSRTGS
jgi:hypothetical protein